MISEIYYSPVYCGVSKQLNLLDFNFKNLKDYLQKKLENINRLIIIIKTILKQYIIALDGSGFY